MAAVLALQIELPRRFLPMDALARARGVDPAKYREGLGCREMSVSGPGEDPVTLAAGAAWRLVGDGAWDPADVGLCVVGTESGVDRAKPVAIWVHDLVGLPAACSVFDVKHACYGGTAALRLAMLWADAHPGRTALVVAADVARYAVGSPGEATQGAGAVALLVGTCPDGDELLRLAPRAGTCARQVADFWQPLYQRDAVVHGKYSIDCYLRSLEGALLDYGPDPDGPPEVLLYHAPYPRIAVRAHACQRAVEGGGDSGAATDFERRVGPGLWVNQRVGNAYAASIFLSLAGVVERRGASLAGRRVGLFSYGSGSCGEYATGTFGRGAARSPEVETRLGARCPVDVAEYQRLRVVCDELEADGSRQDDLPPSGGAFTFLGIREHQRAYRRD